MQGHRRWAPRTGPNADAPPSNAPDGWSTNSNNSATPSPSQPPP